MKLENKVAIVTGGTTGIGKAIALGFAKEGADVVVTSRGISASLDQIAKEIESLGRKCLAIKCDIKIKKQLEKLVKETINKFGKIDILVNNAAVYPMMPFLEVSEEQLNDVIDTNLKGPFFCTQIVLKEMIKRKSGRIININSSQSRLPSVTIMTDYAMTKSGLLGLTRCTAFEFGSQGININGLACGLTPTDSVRKIVPEAAVESIRENLIPLKRLADPKDYVGLAVLLASDEGSYINGQTIYCDGGLVMP